MKKHDTTVKSAASTRQTKNFPAKAMLRISVKFALPYRQKSRQKK